MGWGNINSINRPLALGLLFAQQRDDPGDEAFRIRFFNTLSLWDLAWGSNSSFGDPPELSISSGSLASPGSVGKFAMMGGVLLANGFLGFAFPVKYGVGGGYGLTAGTIGSATADFSKLSLGLNLSKSARGFGDWNLFVGFSGPPIPLPRDRWDKLQFLLFLPSGNTQYQRHRQIYRCEHSSWLKGNVAISRRNDATGLLIGCLRQETAKDREGNRTGNSSFDCVGEICRTC